jgi:hypothetical protein
MRNTMSKQLTLSAFAAILSMAAFALSVGLGAFATGTPDHLAGNTPLMDLSAAR